jgi:hypothetical protein
MIFETTAEVSLTPTDALTACQKAIVSFGWKVTALGSGSITVVDKVQDLGMNPVTITIEFLPSDLGTVLTLKAHIRGLWGGGNHMKGRVGQLVNAISLSSQPEIPSQTFSRKNLLSVEIDALAKLHELGHLTDVEFTAAKAKLFEKTDEP